MKCTRFSAYVGLALCSLFLIYEMLQHVELENVMQYCVSNCDSGEKFPFKDDTAVENLTKVITVLERMKTKALDPNDKLGVDTSIAYLKSELRKISGTNGRGIFTLEQYFTPHSLWDTKKSNWKENFYPDSNYSGEICDEVYVRPGDGIPPFPYFKLKETCARDSPKTISNLVTLVLNFQSYSKDEWSDITRIVSNSKHMYPGIPILMAIPENLSYSIKDDNVSVFTVQKGDKPGKIWNVLIKQVNTPYVFVGKDIMDFEEESNLERLVRETRPLNLNITGSAVKTFLNGHWSYGCYQMAHKNYTLVYKLGYKHSAHDCLYCHSIQGPFLAKTAFLKANPFDSDLPESVLFHDYFFALFKKKQHVGVCPDSMFNVRDDTTQPSGKRQWLPLVIKRSLNKITSPEGKSFVYTCSESKVLGEKKGGLAIAPCTLQKLADHIKFVMRTCREHNIMCELNAGTTVGAVKFNGVLPWERDADIFYLSSNFTAVGKLKPVFKKAGYILKLYHKPGQGGTHGGAYLSYGSGWKLDFYSKPWLHSAELKSQGKKPTKVMFNGEWIEVPNNVGKEIRDRYGPEVYKHVEHYMVLNRQQFNTKTGYTQAGHFTKCPKPGAHNCLDKLPADGNLEFNSDP